MRDTHDALRDLYIFPSILLCFPCHNIVFFCPLVLCSSSLSSFCSCLFVEQQDPVLPQITINIFTVNRQSECFCGTKQTLRSVQVSSPVSREGSPVHTNLNVSFNLFKITQFDTKTQECFFFISTLQVCLSELLNLDYRNKVFFKLMCRCGTYQ